MRSVWQMKVSYRAASNRGWRMGSPEAAAEARVFNPVSRCELDFLSLADCHVSVITNNHDKLAPLGALPWLLAPRPICSVDVDVLTNSGVVVWTQQKE